MGPTCRSPPTVESRLEARLPEATVTRRLRTAYVAALEATASPWGLEGVTDADREAVSERLAVYHENIAMLLKTLNLETRLIEGPLSVAAG
jgi:hypothetical protein